MSKRKGTAHWDGNFPNGKGKVKFGSFEGDYSFKSRFENGAGTNPEEMIAAAHAGCFSMALSKDLSDKGFEPKKIQTTAEVTIEILKEGPRITLIELNTEADVPKLSKEEFLKFAEGAKKNCPVSQALKSVEIKLNAKLK
jgi:osmotically inducible protein OsmC